jgi:metal-sulfur cluster biosynthetic enzyme
MTAFTAGAAPDSGLATRLEQALGEVLDPCSVFNGSRLSFLDLGMVDSVEFSEPGRVTIRLLLDDPVCLYVAQIHDQIRQAALSVDGVEEVTVEFSGEAIWTEERATPETRRKIQLRQEQLRRRIAARRHVAEGRRPTANVSDVVAADSHGQQSRPTV